MRVFMMAVALVCAGCAAPRQPAQAAATQYVQIVDLDSGKIVAEIDVATSVGCQSAQAQAVKQLGLKEHAGLVRCSETSAANQLPYRLTVRTKSTQHLMDWHFLSLADCQDTAAIKEQMNDYALVAQCGSK